MNAPAKIPATWPENRWYAAGWKDDIGRVPLARTICGRPLVFYRRLDGKAVAMEDACMHRLLPLSLGFLEGDDIVCGYHGMKFDCSGRCVRMPVPNDPPPPGGRVPAYRLAELHNLVWVWIGDDLLADPELIPDMHWADDPDWKAGGAHFEMACDYRLVLDNLMDLTHETYVHSTSIGHGDIVEAPFEVSRSGETVTLSRWMIDCSAPPFLAMQFEAARGRGPEHVDRWQLIHYAAPSTIVIDVGVAPTGTGAPGGDRSKGVSGRVLNTVTPQSDGRCYYFFAYARSYALDDAALTGKMRAANIAIFAEDKVVLEEQQRMLDLMPHRKLLNLNIDKGAMWARRAIDKLMEPAEAAE